MQTFPAERKMAANPNECLYCGRDDFASSRGLVQHYQQSRTCKARHQAFLKGRAISSPKLGWFFPLQKVIPLSGKDLELAICHNTIPQVTEILGTNTNKRTYEQLQAQQEDNHSLDDNNNFVIEDDDGREGEQRANDVLVSPSITNLPQPNPTLRQNFQAFCQTQHNSLGFTQDELNAIKLLRILRQTKAPLNAYELHMKWHLEASGKLRSHESLQKNKAYVSQDSIYKKLRIRYNLGEGYRNIERITLPHSKSEAKIIWHDAKAVMVSLLTDPRITDEDYLFFGNDPCSPPPSHLNYVGDLNTGKAYLKTYKRLITNPSKQILLPVVFYIDGANTGQFADLPVTAVKFSLGIFTRKARDKDHCWSILGYLPAVSKHKSKARRIMKESGHVDGTLSQNTLKDGEGLDDNDAINKAQDLHTMLSVVLRSYIDLQKTGFIWDFCYNNQVYKDMEFVLFTPFLKVDGEEADKLCGKYGVRTGNVAQLCRYCECPTDKSDRPLANYPLKTTKKIQRLIDRKDDEALKQLSQHRINNAMYSLRYGSHNKQGIHGACPWEMLHALLLGVFRYVRDCFFQQLGEKGKLSDKFNAYAMQYGKLFSRQSDRNLPPSKFAAGIKKGKLTAKEYPGILLCMAAVLRCTGGRKLLMAKKKKEFGPIGALRDWSQLLETLLQWERWLRSPTMQKNHVRQAREKHRYILYLVKKVAKRTEGMQFKTQKFHGVVHLADDILNFGVPLEVDTGSNESGHKLTKVAAKLTQRNEETFDEQTSIRLEEVHLLEMANAELEGDYMTDCLFGRPKKQEVAEKHAKPTVGGSEHYIIFDNETQQYRVCTTKNLDPKYEVCLEKGLIDFIGGLQKALDGKINQISLQTVHRRHGKIFRGDNDFRNGVWRDWAFIEWQNEGKVPNKIWGFVDLSQMQEKCRVNYGGIRLYPGTFAVVETSSYVENEMEQELSEIFVPIVKHFTENENADPTMQFYLADVEAISDTCAVIPDIGGPPNRYFYVKDRDLWKKDFEDFLEKPLDIEAEISEDEESITRDNQ